MLGHLLYIQAFTISEKLSTHFHETIHASYRITAYKNSLKNFAFSMLYMATIEVHFATNFDITQNFETGFV